MDRQDVALTFISVSIILGLAAGIALNPGTLKQALEGEEQSHEHALFFVYANNTEIDLTADRFQLQSETVHLENGRSHVVHKHAAGVTWGQFLETLNISINQTGNQSCIRMPNKTFCGNATLMLNGEKFDPTEEIQQGDKLALVIAEESSERAEAYMELDLPEAYRERLPGTRV